MANNPSFTQEYLRQCVQYDSETGEFLWLKRPESHFLDKGCYATWNTKHAFTKAFTTLNYEGYFKGKINAHALFAHRVAWFWVFGEWPDKIDHIDGDRQNNRISNLRNVSDAENAKNKALRKDNKSGCPGVMFEPAKKLWRVRFSGKNGKRFKNLDDAIRYRKDNEAKFGFQKFHGRKPIC